MRLKAFIVAVIYVLQGCATTRVIELAQGIDKSNIQASADVEAIWNDSIQHEFIICMIDQGKFPNKKGDRYMFRIPKNLISQEPSERVKFEPRTISELKPELEQHWWDSLYRNRNDVKVYDLSIVVDDNNCIKPKASWNSIQVLKAPQQLTSDEAIYFRGEAIKMMNAAHEPFLIFSPQPPPVGETETVCSLSGSEEGDHCLLLVASTQIKDIENPATHFDVIFSVKQLIWTSEPKPIWYLAMPFAVITDAVIIGAALMLIGAGGPGI